MSKVRDLMGKASFKKGKLPHKFVAGSKVRFNKGGSKVTYPIKHGGKFK